MRDAEPPLSGSAVTGGGFVGDLSKELESLRLPGHQSRDTEVAPERSLSHTTQKSGSHQVSAYMRSTRFMEGRVAARLGNLAVLHENCMTAMKLVFRSTSPDMTFLDRLNLSSSKSVRGWKLGASLRVTRMRCDVKSISGSSKSASF